MPRSSTGHITMGSWKGRGNQYIQFVRVLYCKLPTNGKQLPAFPSCTIEYNRGSKQCIDDGRVFDMTTLNITTNGSKIIRHITTKLYPQSGWFSVTAHSFENIVKLSSRNEAASLCFK